MGRNMVGNSGHVGIETILQTILWCKYTSRRIETQYIVVGEWFLGGEIQDAVVRHLVEYAGKWSRGVVWLQKIPA